MTNSANLGHPEQPAQQACRRTQWPALIRLAASRFSIAPADFWKLSVAEWRALTGDEAQVLTRRGLEALAQLYPDEP